MAEHDTQGGITEDVRFLFDEEPPPPPPEPWFDPEPPMAPPADPPHWDDLPPAPEHQEYRLPDRSAYTSGRGKREEENPELVAKIVTTIRDCFAATHGRYGDEAADLVQYVLGSETVLKKLDKQRLRIIKRVGEILVAASLDAEDCEFDLFNIADLEVASDAVRKEMHAIRAVATVGEKLTNPTSVWRALCDYVQKEAFVAGALETIELARADAPADELMTAFASLEPPTTVKTAVNASFSKSAADWAREAAEQRAERDVIRISSGYRTLDFAMTAKDAAGNFAEPLGSFAPGEVHTFAAPSGNGKSSAVRRLIPAAAEDLTVGWGREHAKVLLAFTEESADTVAEAAGLMPGQPLHHLAHSVVLADVGASRKRFIHAVWDLVIEAYHMSKATGLPIVDCGLPEFIALDYVTAIQEQGESETLASEVTMDLLLRGLAGWRAREMEQFTGENFSAYAGMSWPGGMENFKPVVITFAQFRKIDGAMNYDPATCNEEDFVVENERGESGWKVLETDFRVPRIADIRGSGKIVQHSDSVILLHRSRPTAAKFQDPVTGRYRLNDDRARWIFLKTRNSADLRFVPMRFDSNATGKRGQFYDLFAEQAIEQGLIKPLSSYTQPGDPILPARPVKSPFAGVAY